MNKTKYWVITTIAFLLMVAPMMVLDIMLSPLSTWRRISIEFRRQAVLGEIRTLVTQVESDLHKRRQSRAEVN
jgi:hypothetical protein